MRKQLAGIGKRKLNLVPGAGVGPVHATIPKRATDFVWCGFRLLANRRAVELLAARGVMLPHGPAIVRAGKEKTDTYVALELNPVPLLDDETLKRTTLAFCPKCGECRARDRRAARDLVGGYVKSRMPKGRGLVRPVESLVTLATDDMMESFRSLGLTGLEFEEVGSYT